MASHQDISDRLRFLSIDADTRSQLAAFLPVIQRELPGILKGFYAHLGQWPELTQMFEGPSASARAEKAQGEHWMKLFSGRFDDGYTESVRRIGLMHSRIGLEPRFYMGGYAFILNHLYAVASRMHASRMQPGGAQARTAALLRALNQAVMLDMDLAISIYIDENKATFERKLGGLSDSFASRVGPLVGEVATQAASLKSAAVSITDTARRTAQQASLVASAAREASGGVGTVAAAAEQLATSVDEIARQVAHSSAMTQQAVDTTHRTDGFVRALASGAQKIGEVVGLIDTVAAQTNLLALNATIEAARAGEAGKGFAVVASEVKSLAGQTRSATEVIGQQVNEMQSATRNVVEAIGGITAAISELNKVATAIAAAVEQQGAATREISRSVQETAAGTRQVTDNISRVDEGVRATGDAAAAALRVAESQEQQADKLRSEVAAFVTQIRAA